MNEETITQDAEVIDLVEPGHGAEVGDLQDMVDDLIVHLHEAKSVPLSNNAMIDRELFLSMLERIRADLPDDLRAARWMVREREAFISRTNEKAREIVDRARKEADELVSDSNIVTEAVEEANILVRRAEGEARRLRLEAEDELEKELQQLEGMLGEVLILVQGARKEFHQARPAPPDVPF
jgi:vacuolar-type H+-ATPase subunit H